MKQLLFCLLVPLLLVSCQDSAQKKILIYTHNGEGYLHDNIETATGALEEMCNMAGIAYDISDDPSLFTEENLEQYHALVFNNTNNDAFQTQDQRLVFRRYIEAGGGFVGIHSACGSERNWPWFWSMLGGTFVRHCPYQAFDVKIIDPDHPSTIAFSETWAWEDEGYYLQYLNPGIHVLLAHDMNTIEDAGKENYPGKVFGDLFPGAWCQEFEGTRTWYTSYGHKPDHYSDPLFREHLLGGIQWVLETAKPDFTLATATDPGHMINQNN